ncbi:bifunctional adenosylcobinamide kinase/adenosylcobinamide-phosphate guanylyltransferase [Vibrio salinus]|uniref:bifunctional adenosylcobinamide kinase/adenosylcobinamide-phosphate guanylyltransferase n=1 Tax=Vibrio salinus TaxID=2899784 RepID=UPI001E28A4F0|nr:bifunctional adenosylcobinamide kinase/adenosylcobinamide-phosphate guanylyltransferase [Vibrio salinus]MCE0496302.1 bifunctional adenosylcobinamide kinase/adenosylcobinamide-phosphate guanylyltransferase [Vibrio salinus]
MSTYLILGGARSGKSRFAESIVSRLYSEEPHTRLHYVATAIAFDAEMKERITEHQKRRGSEWIEHECPTELASKLQTFQRSDVVLVDCLTIWLNNIIYNDGNDISQNEVQDKVQELVRVLSDSEASYVLVSNEVGLGVVPMGKITRLFVDNAGWMNQAIAGVVDNVFLVSAGLPLVLKGAL